VGFDDGVCEVAPDGVHRFVLDELAVNATGGQLAKVHRCACGAEAYEATEDPAARPPL
jgi:hypothetical protein